MKRINLNGEVINLRLVEENDTEFIVNLRTKAELSKFISSTNVSINEQLNWIKNYKVREKKKVEFYFIIENKYRIPCGTVRIYNINYERKECTWGSFILDKTRPNGASNEVINLSLNFILQSLNLNKVFLEVKRENFKAIHIYEKNGFLRINKDEENYYYYKNL